MKTYHVEMDDGKRMSISADSASNAIGRALIERLGHRVTKCWVGMRKSDAPGMRDIPVPVRFEDAAIVFDIPPHDPLLERPVRPVHRQQHAPCELFDDGQVLSESAQAKTKRIYRE